MPMATITALRLETPLESWVMPRPIPKAINVISTGPREGVSNQPVAEMYVSVRNVTTLAEPNDIQKLDLLPPRIPPQNRPPTKESPTSQVVEITGSCKKSLNSIAANCFSNTATQKIGSEKNRKAMKVMV